MSSPIRALTSVAFGLPSASDAPEMFDRLAVRVDRLGPCRGLEVGRDRLRGTSGLALVRADEGEAGDRIVAGRCLSASQGLGRPAMEQPPTGQARRVVSGVAKTAVAEVVAKGAPGPVRRLAHDAPSDQFLERVDRLLLSPAAGRADGRQVE